MRGEAREGKAEREGMEARKEREEREGKDTRGERGREGKGIKYRHHYSIAQ